MLEALQTPFSEMTILTFLLAVVEIIGIVVAGTIVILLFLFFLYLELDSRKKK